MRTIAFSLLTGLCLLAACGDDDDSSSDSDSQDRPYVEALSTALQSEEAGSFSEEQANCLAGAIVDAVGVNALEDADVTPEQLADADDIASLNVEAPADAQEELTGAIDDCRITLTLEDQMVAAFKDAVGATLTAASQDCLTGELDDETVRSTWAATALDASSDSSELESQFDAAMAACPGTMTEIILGGDALAAAYGGEVPEDAGECIGGYVETNAEAVAQTLTSGDDAASQTLMTAIAAACPATAEPAPA